MKSRLLAISAVFCAVLALAGFGWGFVEQREIVARASDQRRLSLLESENERLRGALAEQEKKTAQAENIVKRSEIERATSAIRELPFKQPVTYDVLTRAGIQKIIEGKLTEQFSDEEIKNMATGLAALGLLPRDYPLKEKYIELLGEQVAAFYDQHQHKLFMFEDASLASAQNRVILSHELTHALQDQNFGLLKLPLEIKTNDDRAAAASALVEGDATLVMSQYMMQNMSLGALRDTLSGTLTQSTKQLRDAPRYLREMLIFPYLRGQEFCAALIAQGGWPALDAAYKHPPSSTSQILHPEKFLANPREEPVRIDFGNDLTVNGEKPLADNVLGEMGIRIMLSECVDAKTVEQAASGWRGDRYLVFDKGDALVWKSVWANEADAGRFWDIVKHAVRQRYGLNFTETGSTKSFVIYSPHAVILTHIEPNEVILVDAKTKKWADTLIVRFVNPTALRTDPDE